MDENNVGARRDVVWHWYERVLIQHNPHLGVTIVYLFCRRDICESSVVKYCNGESKVGQHGHSRLFARCLKCMADAEALFPALRLKISLEVICYIARYQ